jgi:hypothetical protein
MPITIGSTHRTHRAHASDAPEANVVIHPLILALSFPPLDAPLNPAPELSPSSAAAVEPETAVATMWWRRRRGCGCDRAAAAARCWEAPELPPRVDKQVAWCKRQRAPGGVLPTPRGVAGQLTTAAAARGRAGAVDAASMPDAIVWGALRQ